ncbi:hypothetical protein GIB67_002624 [Kingdonia uniflora]|uniref:DNA-directed DNA polymerase n=1 Tax=Kingdonia uniflora TaxID=39325 RepID=A0A7J7N4G8_9MAGN|nr:hypothetical protein GIB67_002624 [Kingdonia uniflora]
MSSVVITAPSAVDQSHAIAVATAATTEAAVATAQAAMEVVRLTRPSNSIRENNSAIMIQTAFRGYLESLENVDNITGIRIVYFHNFSRFDGILILKYYTSNGGVKGSIQHDKLRVSMLQNQRDQLLDYMRQDIHLLAGVVMKTQEIYWTEYSIDITSCLTLSSQAMKIFRSRYYNDKEFPIHIPNRNEDEFFRSGYYGGMQTSYIITPKNINKPFLPIRDRNGTLLIPKGKFVGVYLSEELIYAHKLRYKIFLLKGYTFKKKPSLLKNFISEVYESRLKAKKSGDDAMSYGYEILMNSLYGRFGINPESTITKNYRRKRYDELTQRKQIIMGDKLSDDYYIISYIGNARYMVEDELDNKKKELAIKILKITNKDQEYSKMLNTILRRMAHYNPFDNLQSPGDDSNTVNTGNNSSSNASSKKKRGLARGNNPGDVKAFLAPEFVPREDWVKLVDYYNLEKFPAEERDVIDEEIGRVEVYIPAHTKKDKTIQCPDVIIIIFIFTQKFGIKRKGGTWGMGAGMSISLVEKVGHIVNENEELPFNNNELKFCH